MAYLFSEMCSPIICAEDRRGVQIQLMNNGFEFKNSFYLLFLFMHCIHFNLEYLKY